MIHTPNARPKNTGRLTRDIAAMLLIDILHKKQPLDEAWSRALIAPRAQTLEARDKAFIRYLISTCLRRRGQIDHAISDHLQKALPPKARKAEAILQIATAECLFLNTPDHAVVNSAVDLAQQGSQTRPYKKLINAVLRRIVSHRESYLEKAELEKSNTPNWLFETWVQTYGNTIAGEIAAAHLREPPIDLSCKDPADASHWAKELEAEILPTGSLRRTAGGQVETWPGFEDGRWWIQDAAAALPVQLFGEVNGNCVIDLCAAPGGKTAQLAANGAMVTAVDRSASRLQRLSANLERLSLDAEIVAADVATWQPEARAPFVLLDAPCSATGTLRRHPDIGFLKTPGDIVSLAKAQTRLLSAAANMTAPGGTLIYCTCSLQPEEGPAQIEEFLATHDAWRRRPIQPDELSDLSQALTPNGDVRTLPCHWSERGGMDGFFIARLTAPA